MMVRVGVNIIPHRIEPYVSIVGYDTAPPDHVFHLAFVHQ